MSAPPASTLSALNQLGWAQITGNDGSLYHSWTEVYPTASGGFSTLDDARSGTTTACPMYSSAGGLIPTGSVVPFKRGYYDPTYDWVYVALQSSEEVSADADAIWLNATTQYLDVALSEAAVAEIPWTADYFDTNTQNVPTTETSVQGVTTGTTPAHMVQGISSATGIRGVRHVSVNNSDSIAHTVAVSILDGATRVPLVKVALAVNSSLHFDYKTGEWYTLPTAALPVLQGSTGAQGLIGQQGFSVIGLDGDDGIEGMPIPGNPGPTGQTGPVGQGIPGLDGDEGEMGLVVPGNPGQTGAKGDPGAAGAKGDQGIQGVLGLDGDEGEMGLVVPGPAGIGVQGPPGVTVPGLDGEPGVEGVFAMLQAQVTSEDGITAFAGGGQSQARKLWANINRVTVVATQDDSVSLPVSYAGAVCAVINWATVRLRVFGDITTTDTINGANSAFGVGQAPKSTVVYLCSVAGQWFASEFYLSTLSGYDITKVQALIHDASDNRQWVDTVTCA